LPRIFAAAVPADTVCHIAAHRVTQITSRDGDERHTGALLLKIKRGPAAMNHTILLQKLIAIERAIGVETNNTIRDLVYDAENHLLQMQRDGVQGSRMPRQDKSAGRFQFLREVVGGGVSKVSF
jgi:hypothetical protein